MKPTIHIYPFETADGATNMATDEHMLEGAAAGSASFRCYAWSQPTVSLGYFQPSAVRLGDRSLADRPYVRRTTGGATLVHHHELTYALALPAGSIWQPRGESWICRMHGIIGSALESLGVSTRAVVCGAERKFGDVLCFQHQTAGDLIVADHKIGGSAQRKQRGALLQHGGILLEQSPFTPSLPGIRELTGIDVQREPLCTAIRTALMTQAGWTCQNVEWTSNDRERIQEIAEQKYRSREWNEKR